jgi:hypothetical protein
MKNEIVPIDMGLTVTQRVNRNHEAVLAVKHAVLQHHVQKIDGKTYLNVSGAQAIGSAMGYTTAIRSLRYVKSDALPGYWEAVAVVLDAGNVVGEGVGCVFDDERGWSKRPHFARQMMAQTRASGRALKGVMGWAAALIGAESSLAEEMPDTASTMAQDEPPTPRRLAAHPKPETPVEAAMVGESTAPVRLVGECCGVQPKESKNGKPYWRIGIKRGDGNEWFTSFEELPDMAGKQVVLTLKPYRDGMIVADCVEDEANVPF